MVAWWTLDERSGTTATDLLGQYNGAHVNGPTPVAGMVDGALSFDGNVIYDPAALEIVNCSKDPTQQFELVQCNPSFAPNAIRFNITSLNGVSGDVIMLSFASYNVDIMY